MFVNATVSSRSSSSRSGNSCSRNSSMPSLRLRNNPSHPHQYHHHHHHNHQQQKTSYNPLFRHSDAFTCSFDASHFIFQEEAKSKKDKPSHHPVLRRYNSHDPHISVHIIDTKREPPDAPPGGAVQVVLTKTKSSIASSTTTTSSSVDSKNTKYEEYEARDFLERYSLPRVVRVEDGEPVLLYRCFDSFSKIQARGILGKKGKERVDDNILHFPEGYSGWFSLTNDKGEKSAISYTSILQLVREQVCSFISMQSFTAYAIQSSDLTDSKGKGQYLKTQVRGGQLFQLRAVFQHQDRPESGRNSTKSSRIMRSARDKDLANRYAQLISQNNQEFYVQLTTKGEFYEIHSSMKAKLCFPGMLDKTGPLALDKDCLYKISHLLRRVALPFRVKLMLGPLPAGLPKDYTDTFILEKKFQEPLLVTCTLPANSSHEISCINLNSNLKLSKCTLGFDSENRLFKSQKLQSALAYCHKNVENWYREVQLIPNLKEELYIKASQSEDANSDLVINPENLDEDLNNLNALQQKQLITKEVLEKFPKSKKWYRNLKLFGNQNPTTDQNVEVSEKGKSMDRYKDMSKLIEEKFGKKSYNPVKKSASFMFSNKVENSGGVSNKNQLALLKCQSLDSNLYSTEADRRQSRSNISDSLSYDFQMCILENESGSTGPKDLSKNSSKIGSKNGSKDVSKNLSKDGSKDIFRDKSKDEIKPLERRSKKEIPKLSKSKPDLIPTLPKQDPSSYVTSRLCSEFHVKTKVLKSPFKDTNVKLISAQVHVPEEIPYSPVADAIHRAKAVDHRAPSAENIYAEICENASCQTMDSDHLCKCRSKKSSASYCYVKLGSNGDSVSQSDSDEAIYNTLR